MTIRKELIDELLKDCKAPTDLTGADGLLSRLTGALVERMLEAEMSQHLGYEKHDPIGRGSGNSRNGHTSKTLKTERGELEIEVPRDRQGSFEPQVVPKRETHFDGFDDVILSLYGRGMTVREIQGHLKALYKTDVSPDLISKVTDAVLDEVKVWRNRSLDALWPIVILDALVLKVREQGAVRNKSAYVALGLDIEGHKHVLGLWIDESEGAKLWLNILTELRTRGVDDILIACCDGLKGFPQAIETVFPRTIVQTCIVHMIRNSLRFVSWNRRKRIAAELRTIYSAENRAAAAKALDEFEATWGTEFPHIVKSWRANWERVVPFLDFPPSIRRVIYTTNAIESLNACLRKVLTPKGHFPNDDAAYKVLYLAIHQRMQRWNGRPVNAWHQALQHFSIYFEGRLPL
jgi:putative transposase